MTAQELRIGNWVVNVDEYWEVRFVDFNFMYIEKSCPFKPIPLTEEWLLKFGFKKRGRDDMPRTISYNLNDLFSIFPSNNFCDFAGYGFIWYKPDRDKSIESARFKFKYVHQLQNLYFTLTEEELTFEQD